MKWIALLSMLACSSAVAQTAPPDPITVIRAQIMQYWFPAPQINLDFAVSFDLDREGRLIGEPVIVAKGHGGDSALEMNYAVKLAQPFFLLRPEDYESWKHVTTNFTQADKRSTDIYAFTKKDILGVATGMTDAAAKAAMIEKGCRVSSPSTTELECTTGTGDKLVVRLTANLSPNLVTAETYVLRSGAPAREIVGSISAQFHTRPFNQVWHLSNFSTMEFTGYSDQQRPAQPPIPSWALIISEPRLLEKDRDALVEKQRAVAPTPKF